MKDETVGQTVTIQQELGQLKRIIGQSKADKRLYEFDNLSVLIHSKWLLERSRSPNLKHRIGICTTHFVYKKVKAETDAATNHATYEPPWVVGISPELVSVEDINSAVFSGKTIHWPVTMGRKWSSTAQVKNGFPVLLF
nr:hypothetical protein Iba_chr12cCG5310 [Ipomoea batatas]